VSYHNYRSCYKETKGSAGAVSACFGSHVAQARSYAWWNWQDPAPFFASGLLAARRFAGAFLRKLRLR
jgi:hypothetical protein